MKVEGAAASATSLLPKDTGFIAGLSATKLKESKIWEKYGKMVTDSGKADFDEVRAECGIDVIGELEQIVVAGNEALDEKKFVVLVKGKWEKDKANKCFAVMLKKKQNKDLKFVEEGKLTKYTVEGDPEAAYLAWVAKDTVMFAPGSMTDKTYLEHVTAGTSKLSDNAALTALLKQVDTSATVWGAMVVPKEGKGADLFSGMEGEKPNSVYFNVHFVKDLKVLAGLRFASDAGAKATSDRLSTEFKAAKENPMLKDYLASLKVEPKGNDAIISLELSEQQVDQLLTMLEQQLGMLLPMMLGGM